MKRLLAILLCLSLIGCKGPKGDQGDPGPGRVSALTGIIPSDFFTVTDSRLSSNSNVAVYIGSFSSNQWAELPYFLPLVGVNTYYLLKAGRIEIYNAQTAGGLSYNIVIVSPNSAPAPAGDFGDRLLW
jgi:hypothetical protein